MKRSKKKVVKKKTMKKPAKRGLMEKLGRGRGKGGY